MLSGKTAVVTGASRGIGAAVAVALAQAGADVAVLYRGSRDKAEQTAEQIQRIGRMARIYCCDVASEEECAETVKQILKDFSRIDILVNNAGITRDMLLLQMKETDFTDVIDTNLKGAFHMIRQCYRSFMKQRSGKIINISSVAGLMGNAGQANYAASKAGLIGLTKSVAKELGGRGICCNAIAPGLIETDMTREMEQSPLLEAIPAKRMGRPEEVAATAVFLAENDYITGEVIRVDGGLAM